MLPDPKPQTIRLKGKAYKEFRETLYRRDKGMCQDCDKWVPLYDGGVFNLFTCAHVAHIKSRGAGGGDTLDNAKLKCYECHINKEHGPQWGIK